MKPGMPNMRALFLALCLLLVACAGEQFRRDGMTLISEGKYEEGLAEMSKAVDSDPLNAYFRKEYLSTRDHIIRQMLSSAETARREGNYARAEQEYRRILGIDPVNIKANNGIELLARDRRHALLMDDSKSAYSAGDAMRALQFLQAILAENPEHRSARIFKREIEDYLQKHQTLEPALSSASQKPINLEFRDANVKMVFESLSRTTNINFIFDKDVRPDLRTTLFLRNSTIEQALDLIAQTAQLQRKILSSNTVLIYPNTPEKQKEYQELVIRAFYLKNAEAKIVQNNLKAILKTRDMVVDEKLNLIVIRDTPDALNLAGKLIALHDVSEPEVMLEVEVLEVQRSRLTEIGVQWPESLVLTPLTAAGKNTVTINDLRNLNSSSIAVGGKPGENGEITALQATVNLTRDVTNADILANPRIRARNRQKANIMIGDKIPILQTTSSSTGFVSENFQYLDVGLKLEVEPEIRLTDEVAIKVALEVSSITATLPPTKSGAQAYQIGTRNASTSLLLRDGETQILAGLISNQERASGKGIPGLADLPILGRLFGSQADEGSKTEIVLSITPRIVRALSRPELRDMEFWSGTESMLRTKPLNLDKIQKPVSPATSSISPSSENRYMPTEAPKLDAPRHEAAKTDPPKPDAMSQALRAQSPVKNVELSWSGTPNIKPGETTTLSMKIKTDGSIRGLPLQIGTDNSSVQVLEVSAGNFFSQDNGNATLTKQIDPENGKVYVTLTRSDVDGASGEGVVLNLKIRALDNGKNRSDIKVLQAGIIPMGNETPQINLPAPFVLNMEK